MERTTEAICETGNTAEQSEVVKVVDGFVIYFCPGCNVEHRVQIENGDKAARWTWNGDKERPTISPSIFKVTEPRCHHYVQEGRIQYLSDTEHALSGSTVPMRKT